MVRETGRVPKAWVVANIAAIATDVLRFLTGEIINALSDNDQAKWFACDLALWERP